jgi:hypothetical protein
MEGWVYEGIWREARMEGALEGIFRRNRCLTAHRFIPVTASGVGGSIPKNIGEG